MLSIVWSSQKVFGLWYCDYCVDRRRCSRLAVRWRSRWRWDPTRTFSIHCSDEPENRSSPMNRTRHRRAALFSCGTVLLLLLIPVGLTAFALYRQQRQERLDQALIAAAKANDTKAVVALLTQGADANAHDELHPPVPFWRLLSDRLKGRKPKPSNAPTPLMLALMWKDKPKPDWNVAFPPE